MFDCHYDLLTMILMNKDNPNRINSYCKKIYNFHNISGGILNLFYMSLKEMSDELNIYDINVISNLHFAKTYIEKNLKFLDNSNFIFGIEGLDYLQNISDIDSLYSLGLRSTNIVWNNQNQFGGGSRSDNSIGLSHSGKKLVYKLIEKHIAIDLSHSNEKTFWDIITICNNLKNEGYSPIVFASHSNCKNICNHVRNLDDEQIIAIKNLDGLIGLVSIKPFCYNSNNITNSSINYRYEYIKHFNHIKNLLHSTNNIAIATDDMKYYDINPSYYQNINIYPHYSLKNNLKYDLLSNGYSISEIQNIFRNNFKNKILNRL